MREITIDATKKHIISTSRQLTKKEVESLARFLLSEKGGVYVCDFEVTDIVTIKDGRN